MNELEIMQRAKLYMDKLAQGIDPITGQAVPQDSALNNARLARCFLYVSGVLDRVIANGGTVGQHVRTVEFSMTPEQLARVPVSDSPVRMSEFLEALNRFVGDPEMKRPSAKKLSDWLIAKGFLAQSAGADGKNHRLPTAYGLRMGISTRSCQSRDGEYQAVYYDKNMQRLLLDNLLLILSAQEGSTPC